MKVLDLELDFDFYDADQMEAYERESRRVVERVQDRAQYEGKSNAEGFRMQCRIIDDFFEAVFGKGTADRLFHGKDNLRQHMEAFGAVADGARASRDEMLAMASRYAPNRAERRLAEKQQKKTAGRSGVYPLGFAIPDDAHGPTNEPGPTGGSGPMGIHAAAGAAKGPGTMDAPEQLAFMEKFIQMMPEMDAFMKSYRKQQGNGADG